MKIINFRQEETCYRWKDNSIKLERDDLWGDPEVNKASLLAYCRRFLEAEEDGTAHVFYLYGQGGVGKSFTCEELAGKLSSGSYENQLYVVVVDLQRQKNLEDSLKCLADKIAEQMGKQEMFPRFHMAYYNYKMKVGEEVQQEGHTTKWDNLHDNSTFSLASGVAGFLTSFGTVSGVIDLANEGYKWLLKMRDNAQYKGLAHLLEAMGEKELKAQMVRYFAADFRDIVQSKNKKKKKFAFLMDTVESMRYQVFRSGEDRDYLEWLAGPEGLFRLMPDCFWILFGREEIPWKNYDREWENSFISRELDTPQDKTVQNYLLQKLGQDAIVRPEGREELRAVVDGMIRQTQRYLLAVENCVDVYFRIWNENLRKGRVVDQSLADHYRPSLEEIREMFFDGKGKKVISDRFLQYYTLQEREVLYMLVCLGTWTDEILEKLLWKGASGNLMIYEEICATSFIKTEGDGQRSIQGLMPDVIMEECPVRLKKKLLSDLLELMAEREADNTYWLLFDSAVRTASTGLCDQKEWEQLGEQFIRGAEYLLERVRFSEMSLICGKLLSAMQAGGANPDLRCAAGIGKYFVGVFKKEKAGEELEQLSREESFGALSLRMWKSMLRVAQEAGSYEQAYEMACLLEQRLAERPADADYYLILRQKAELMQRLGERFDSAHVEKELQRVCDLAKELAAGDIRTAEKLNARLWAEYYFFGRPDLRGGEIGVHRIRDCIDRYRACCTENEARWDVGLCVLEVMQERMKGRFILNTVNEWALRGLRILDKLYGEQAVNQPDMEFLFANLFPYAAMTNEEGELLRKFFLSYYKSFYKGGNWRAYSGVRAKCFLRGRADNEETGDEETRRVELVDLVRQGILYLSNLDGGNVQDQLRLLLSYHLLDVLLYPFGIHSCDQEPDTDDFLEKSVLNNQILLYFLRQSLDVLCREKKESQRQGLCTLLRAVTDRQAFGSAAVDDKRQLLGLFKLCGMETDRAIWRAEYEDSAQGREFELLDAICGWSRRIDACADIRLMEMLLWLAWRLGEYALEEKVLGQLEKDLKDINERVSFWCGLLQEAQTEGGEWERHLKELLRGRMENQERNYEVSHITKEKLALYNPWFAKQLETRFDVYAGRWDTCDAEKLEMELRDRLAAGDIENMRHIVNTKVDDEKAGRFDGTLGIAYLYMAAARGRNPEGVLEIIQDVKSIFMTGGEYLVLRAYAYLKDKEGFLRWYWEHCEEIWSDIRKNLISIENYSYAELYHMADYVFSLEEKELTEDYCGRMADFYAESGSTLWVVYTKKILCQLGWLTQHVAFGTVWRRESCLKEITLSNYEQIDWLLEKYLSFEERLELFTVGVWSREYSVCEPKRPQWKELSFFEGEYYLWLRERFGEAGEDRLKEELPKLYEARKKYQERYRDRHLWHVNKAVNEIRALAERYVLIRTEEEGTNRDEGEAK